MSCGMPCWYCDKPIPESRHALSPMERVFCSDACRDQFAQPPFPQPPEPSPSYHDLHITTATIPRTSIHDLPYGYEVACTRVTGWQLWKFTGDPRQAKLIAGERGTPMRIAAERHAVRAGGEYDGTEHWLILDVAGHVIVDSRGEQEWASSGA